MYEIEGELYYFQKRIPLNDLNKFLKRFVSLKKFTS